MIITTTKVMRKRDKHDFYPTPDGHADAAVALLPFDADPAFVLDPGAGTGVFGRAIHRRFPSTVMGGVELRDVPPDPSYAAWHTGDFLRMPKGDMPNPAAIVGNPPYKLAEQFVRASLQRVAPGGYVLFLLRLAFLESNTRFDGIHRECPPVLVAPYADRPSFTGNGRTDATAYAAFLWQKGYGGNTELRIISAKGYAPTVFILRQGGTVVTVEQASLFDVALG